MDYSKVIPLINILNVRFQKSQGYLLQEFDVQIDFDSLKEIDEYLDFHAMLLLGTQEEDIFLDECSVGDPIPSGPTSFSFHVEIPDLSELDDDNLVGSAGFMIRCYFKEQQFCTIGFLASIFYEDVDEDTGNLVLKSETDDVPDELDRSKLVWIIKDNKPTLTRYKIDWSI
eukprot:TRINITY_DN2552_c1_g1_i1.p1 TRINITY_DN2552_c1_g1~~TRINITY_DN2552_c1_g1_i1.p1  ORF type:complete len:171 (+),score=55.27 TRINITY_DN2552_c1_g1_i1:45-557(+)